MSRRCRTAQGIGARRRRRGRRGCDAGVLVERLGLVAFQFQLAVRDDAIVWSVVGVRVLGLLPLPRHWFH